MLINADNIWRCRGEVRARSIFIW